MLRRARFFIEEMIASARTLRACSHAPGLIGADLCQLESRILMSASPASAVVEAPAIDKCDAESCEPSSLGTEQQSENADEKKSTETIEREVAFIDGSVPEYGALLADLQAQQSFGRLLDVYVLDSEEDGVQQISDILAGLSDVSAIHIVSHGSDGVVRLGNAWITANNLRGYAGAMSRWADSLTSDADILVYGCDLAKSAAGQELVESLSALTGADVAASTDGTGHTQFGANWELEYAHGTIETAIAFSFEVQQDWQGLLATFTVINTNDSGAGSLRQAILDANASPGLDTINFNIPITDSGRFYYRNDGIAGSLTNIQATSLADASITDFDPDYPYAQHAWFRINLNPGSAPLSITDAVIIDGYSQPGATPNSLAVGQNAKILIELTSTGADNDDGLDFLAGSSGSTVRGLAINDFEYAGVWTDPGVNNVTIQGNFLGTDITGTIDRGNGDGGVHLRSSNNLVGGPNPADRNVISGNDGRGVVTFTFGPIESGNVVRNNYIGVDATGVRALGNTTTGIQVWNQTGMQILDNVISSNTTYGVWLRSGSSASNTVIQGNLIGLGADGVTARGNGSAGILIESTAINTMIGGTVANQGNTIGHNGADGIAVTSGTGAAIQGNSIFSNIGLGIDLSNNGVTLNDTGDGDTGPNRLQNFPVLTSAFTSGSSITISGSLNSTSGGGGRTYRIEFFANTSDDPTGYGEGQRYLGFTNVTTNGSGNATFNLMLSEPVSGGEFISATATDLTTNETSEFAQNRVASPSPPTVTLPGEPVSYVLGNPLTLIDATATVTDADSPDFDTGTLTVSITTNASVDDRLEINNGGIISLSGNVVQWQSGGPAINIGTFAGGTGLTPLVVTLNSNATPARTQDLLRAIGYRNVSVTAPSYSVTVQVELTDGDVGTSTPQTETINIAGVNQAPVNGVPGAQSTNFNAPLTFSLGNGNLVSTTDSDAWVGSVQVTLTVTNGTLTLGGGGLANPVGSEVLTNLTTTNTQSEPAIARAPNGNYVVVWSGYRNGANPAEILFQIYDANGNTIGGQTIANSTRANIQSQPNVAMDQNGDFVIVWTSLGQDNSDLKAGVYGQRFDAAGNTIGGEFLVNTITVNEQITPAIAMDADGDFVVVWVDKVLDGGNEGIFGQRFNSAGTKVGGQFQVNITSVGKQQNPDAAMDAAGNFVVTWDSTGQDSGDGQAGVYARRYDASGVALTGEVLVNTTVVKDQDYPSIAMNAAGNYVITWTSKDNDGNGRGIFGQLYDSAGNRVGTTEFQVNTTTASDQMNAAITMDASGNFAVVWESVNQDNPGDLLKGIYFQQFDRNGTPIGTERLVNTTVAGAQDTPVVAMDADGDIVVAWHGNGAGDTNGVFHRRFDNGAIIAFSVGDGVADTSMTFTGSLANVNDAMNGMTFTPNFNFTGLATLTINTNDLGNTGSGGAKSDSDFVNITIAGNTLPTITSDGAGATASINVAENTTAVTTVTATDPEAPPQTLSYSIVPGGDGAKFAIGPGSGALTFVTPPNFESPTDGSPPDNVYQVTVQVSDGAGGTDTQDISVIGTNVNEGPIAANDGYAGNEDATLNIAAAGVLSNDSDPDGDSLSAVLVSGPINAAAFSVNADGSFSYTPTANFNGVDSFTYRVTDGSLTSGVATVTIAVNPVNDLPVAVDDSYVTTVDAALLILSPGVLANDSDMEGDSLSAALVTGPGNGSILLNSDGSFLYTPNASYTGPDSFTYQGSDGLGNSNVATVWINVVPGNSAPNAVNDGYGVNEDSTLSVPAAGVLSNDADADGDPLTAVLVGGPSNAAAFSLNADGSFSYTPTANFHGVDSFTYRADDGTTQSGLTTVTITVNPVNDPPVANNDGYAVNEDGTLNVAAAGILTNDSDLEGTPLAAVLGTGPSNGSLNLNADGSFSYTPNPDFNGSDSFTYAANDGTANSSLATVTITVNPVNDAPDASGDNYSATEDVTLNVAGPGVLGNDTDIDGDPLTAVLVSGPSNGSLSFNADGSFSYTPNATFNGADSFDYQASDAALFSDVITVIIFVDPVNNAPIATGESYSVNEDSILFVPVAGVLTNDRDVDDDPMTAVLVSGPSSAVAFSLSADGSFTYTPNADFNGSDSFTYKANDGTGDSNVVVVTITVNPVNDAPVAANESYSVTEDTTLNVAAAGVLGNDTDIEGDSLTTVLVSAPTSAASFALNADGSFSYTPFADFNGSDSFTYRANDGTANSMLATVNITVAAVNDAPVAANDNFNVNQDTTFFAPAAGVLGNDPDIDGDPLTATLVSGPRNGSLILNADGSFSYTPNLVFSGSDSFTYKANDGTADSGVATVTLRVNASPISLIAVSPVATPLPVTTAPASTNNNNTESVQRETDRAKSGAPAQGSSSDTLAAPFVAATADKRNSASVELDDQDLGAQLSIEIGEKSTLLENQNSFGEDGFKDSLLRRSLEAAAIEALRMLGGTTLSNVMADFSFLSENGLLWEKLDSLQDGLKNNLELDGIVMGTVSAATSSLTVGYVVWMVRGGVIASTLLAQLPAWKYMDAMVVLAHIEEDVDDEDGSLESIVDRDFGDENEQIVELLSEKRMADLLDESHQLCNIVAKSIVTARTSGRKPIDEP